MVQQVTQGIKKIEIVFNKSYWPYSLVVKRDVYKGKSKKLTNWVENLPIDIIKVFFINSFFWFILLSHS